MASKREILETEGMLSRLTNLLVDTINRNKGNHDGMNHRADAEALRKISMTLQRWHELECGIDGGCIERDETTGKTHWYHSQSGRRIPTPDRETGALKRLAAIMARYPALSYYVQTDPRGCALYIVRNEDIPPGKDLSQYYTRGIAVHK